MLPLGDRIDQRVDIQRVRAQRPGRNLAVEDLRGDVGVIGRNLPPALGAFIGSHPYEANEFVAESLEAGDLHGRFLSRR
jgi:hypothetical protein